VWFEFLVAAMFVFDPSVLVAMILLIGRAWRDHDAGLWIILAWAAGVLVPFTLATSKTPSSTLPAWPAMFLIFGALISRAVRGDRVSIAMWAGVTIVSAACLPFASHFNGVGVRSPVDSVRPVADHLWVVWQVLGGLVFGALSLMVIPLEGWRRVRPLLLSLAALAALPLFAITVTRAWKVTQINANSPSFVKFGEFVQMNLPQNAVLLFEEQTKLERNTAMFRARRTAYDASKSGWEKMAQAVWASAGDPYVVSTRSLPLEQIYTDPDDDRILYKWRNSGAR